MGLFIWSDILSVLSKVHKVQLRRKGNFDLMVAVKEKKLRVNQSYYNLF